jgi:pyruvate dehydrogenase E2 component (dihydrolipoamide acetyltransferase)
MDFLVPKLSATMEEATVLRWLKQAGDRVRMGEPLVEIETDKAAIEVEAPFDATLETILVPEGGKAPIGAALARLAQAGAATSAKPAAVPSEPGPKASASSAAVAPELATAPSSRAHSAAPASRLAASPLARRLAGETAIDLSTLVGSGPGGRIRKRDVLAAAQMRKPAVAPTSTPRPALGTAVVEQDSEALSPMRLGIAEAVSISRRTIPSFALDRWVETAALENARQTLGPQIERQIGIGVTLTDLLLQAMADTLRHEPAMLELWVEGDERPRRVKPASIDIGLVVSVEGGMMIPVLRDLAGKSLGEIARLRLDAVQRVRAGRLLAADSGPASITLSNLGRSGVDRFEAIINPGQSSILAVGREHERVIARGGVPAIAHGFNLTLSVDHRLIDGVRGAAFLGTLADRIEFGPWTIS